MHAILESQIINKQSQVADLKALQGNLQEEFDRLSAERSSQIECTLQPKQFVALHIKRLKEYNELRDIGLRLTQMIADEKSCKIRDIFEELGYELTDE